MKSLINNSREWLKVSQLSAGMQIAVPKNDAFAGYGVSVADESVLEHDAGDVMWDEIEEIRELPEEQVWDIEVEGTHNFVAGHLFDKTSGNQLTEDEETEWISGVDGGGAGLDASSKKAAVWFGGIFAHNTYLDGSVGIGTATPGAKLSIFDQTSDLRDAFTVATSTDGSIFRVDTAGDAYAQGAFNSGGADYAEHFYTDSSDLVPGEVVCVSLENENAVSRCIRPRDGNVMGIVSTNPAIIGNSGNIEQGSSVVVGMLGQVPARVTNENGEIRPGDSLTSASIAGYAMKAGAGDPTVGVALERLDGTTGTVRVLISRRNKSLTVAEVEEAVVDRIAAMEIEDEVALLVSDAVSGYDFDPVVSSIIGTELTALEEDFDLRLSDEITELRALIAAQELQLIEESADFVAINTDLTVSGELKAVGGLIIPLLYSGGGEGVVPSSTPAAFRVSSDGTVTAFSDFVISDGVTSTSVKEILAELTALEMTKTKLTITQDLHVGNSFEVMGSQVAGASTKRPVFKIAADGTVSVREDLVLSGYTQWNDIPGIVSVLAYNTASDSDGGAWVAGNRSASWYTEAIDATADSCDVAVNDRCGLRSFPTQAIIAATADTIYIFNAQDGSLWKKINRHAGGVLADSILPDSPITAIHAADGALYIAQSNSVSIIDFKQDSIASLQNDVLASNTITGIHTQRINGHLYVAVSGDQGVDLVNIDEETSTHFSGAASNARLTASGDLFTVASSTLSVFAKAHLQSDAAAGSVHAASSTLSGLYVSQDGNTAYAASGSTIMSLRGGVLADAAISPQTEFDIGSPITSFHVDEKAHVIYAAYQGGVKALALGDGTELATYESGETSWGDAWTLSGEVQVASLTLSGPVREGELLSDTLIIATPNGLLAQAGDYSLRQSLASGLSGAGAPKEQSNRLTVTNEALFSGRVMVTDAEQLPLFAIDEQSGDVGIREDVRFMADSRIRFVSGASAVFAYDTTQDSDGGQWRSRAGFPQQAILVADASSIRVFDARTKEEFGALALTEGEDWELITTLAAKDGIIAAAGALGTTTIDMLTGEIKDRHAGGVLADSIFADTEQDSIVRSTGLQNDNLFTDPEGREDSLGVPYLARGVVATSTAGYLRAILAEAPAGDRFVWMETAGFSLRDSLNAPRNVFTVIDRLQTPRITSVSSLSFTASSTISFTTGATSTPALVIRDSGDIAISGDVTISGNARMGTTTAESLEITTGYLKLNPKEAAPQAEDCAESSQYGRMSFDALSDTLYLCGQNGWRSFVPNEADPTAEEEVVAEEEPVVEEEVVVEEEPTATSTPEEL